MPSRGRVFPKEETSSEWSYGGGLLGCPGNSKDARVAGTKSLRGKGKESRSDRQQASLLGLAGPEWDHGSDSE